MGTNDFQFLSEYDEDIAVPAPRRCPTCQGRTRTLDDTEPSEHLQEDIIGGVYHVVLYRHVACRCDSCDCFVEQPGEGEILGGRIGPNLRAKAIFLHIQIGHTNRRRRLRLLLLPCLRLPPLRLFF